MAIFPDRIVLKNSADDDAVIRGAIAVGGTDEIQPGEVVLGLNTGNVRLYTRDGADNIVAFGGSVIRELRYLDDVDSLTAPQDFEILYFDSSSGQWRPGDVRDIGGLTEIVQDTSPELGGRLLSDFGFSASTSETWVEHDYFLQANKLKVEGADAPAEIVFSTQEASLALAYEGATASDSYSITLPPQGPSQDGSYLRSDANGVLAWSAGVSADITSNRITDLLDVTAEEVDFENSGGSQIASQTLLIGDDSFDEAFIGRYAGREGLMLSKLGYVGLRGVEGNGTITIRPGLEDEEDAATHGISLKWEFTEIQLLEAGLFYASGSQPSESDIADNLIPNWKLLRDNLAGVLTLGGIGDVSTTGLSDGDTLVWNDAVQTWLPKPRGGASLGDLSDVDTSTTAPALNQALVWDGANWIPGTVAGGGDGGGGGGIEEAPLDGEEYLRKDGGWTVSSASNPSLELLRGVRRRQRPVTTYEAHIWTIGRDNPSDFVGFLPGNGVFTWVKGANETLLYLSINDIKTGSSGWETDWSQMPASGSFLAEIKTSWYTIGGSSSDLTESYTYRDLTVDEETGFVTLYVTNRLIEDWSTNPDVTPSAARQVIIYMGEGTTQDGLAQNGDILKFDSTTSKWQVTEDPDPTSLDLVDFPGEEERIFGDDIYPSRPLIYDKNLGWQLKQPSKLYEDAHTYELRTFQEFDNQPSAWYHIRSLNREDFEDAFYYAGDPVLADVDDSYETAYYPIDVPPFMRGKRFFGVEMPSKIYALGKGGAAIYWGSNIITSLHHPVTGGFRDFEKTAVNGFGNPMEAYFALGENPNFAVNNLLWASNGDSFHVQVEYVDTSDFSKISQLVLITFDAYGGFMVHYGHGYRPKSHSKGESYPGSWYGNEAENKNDRGVIVNGRTYMRNWGDDDKFNTVNTFFGRTDGFIIGYSAPTYRWAFEGAGVDSLGDVDTSNRDNASGDLLAWDSEKRKFTQRTLWELAGASEAGAGQVLSASGERSLVWRDPTPNTISGSSDYGLRAPQSGDLLKFDSSGKWTATPLSEIEAISSVNGEVGAVSLGLQDLNDYSAPWPLQSVRWVLTSGTSTPPAGEVITSGSYVVSSSVDFDGVALDDVVAYLSAADQPIVRFQLASGQTVFAGELLSVFQSGTRVFFEVDNTNWADLISPGEKLSLVFERRDGARVDAQIGDVVTWDGSSFSFRAPALYDATSLTARVTQNETDIVELETAVSNLSSYDDTALTARITAAETGIDDLETTVSNLSNYDDTSLTARVSTVEAGVTDLETTVSNLSSYDDTAIDGRVTSLEGEVATLQNEVTSLQSEVTSLQAELLTKVEEAPEDGTPYVRQDGQWLSLAGVLESLGFVPGGGPTPTPTPEPTPELIDGGDFTSGTPGSVDITFSGGDFTSGGQAGPEVILDGGVFQPEAITIPDALDGGDFTSGAPGSVDLIIGGGDFSTGSPEGPDLILDGGIFSAGAITAGGGNFTTGASGSGDQTIGGGDFSSGAPGVGELTLDGGDFSFGTGETLNGGDFTSGGSGGPDVSHGGGDFTSGSSDGSSSTLDGGDFMSAGSSAASGGDFTSGEAGDSDDTHGGGDFTSGESAGTSSTLDGGDWSVTSGGDFTDGDGGSGSDPVGGGNFTTGGSGNGEQVLDGGEFTD